MRYPLGSEARATTHLEVAAWTDSTIMAPQTEILLQILADMLAERLGEIGSELAPAPAEVETDRASAPSRLAVES